MNQTIQILRQNVIPLNFSFLFLVERKNCHNFGVQGNNPGIGGNNFEFTR